jgi:hypothetical protein
VKFTATNQPSEESREKSAKTKSLKLRVNVQLSELTLGNVFTLDELQKIHDNYKAKFPAITDLAKAKADDVMAYNFLRYITQYGTLSNSENAIKIVKALDTMTIDDLKDHLQPVLNFDKYESLL